MKFTHARRASIAGALSLVLLAPVYLAAPSSSSAEPAQAPNLAAPSAMTSAMTSAVTSVGLAQRPGRGVVKVNLGEDTLEGGTPTLAKVTTKPRLRAARTVLEGRRGKAGAWQVLGRAKTNRKGVAKIAYTAPTVAGPWAIRALVTPSKQAKAWASKPVRLTVTVEELMIFETTEVLPEDISEDPAVSFDPGSGDLVLPAVPSTETIVEGDTVVVPPSPGFESGLLRTVTAPVDATEGDTLTLTTRQASLTEVFQSIPADQAQLVMTQYEATLSNVPEWVTCNNCAPATGDGVLRLADPQARAGRPGATENDTARRQETADIQLRKFDLSFDESIPVGSSSIDFRGSLFVQAVADAVLDIDLDGLKPVLDDWAVEAGIEYDARLSATWEESFSTVEETEREELGDIKGKWVTCVGVPPLCVPFWVEASGTLFLDFTASGEVVISTEISSVGEVKAGLRKAEVGNVPEGYFVEPSGLEVTREIGASGSARAALGVEITADIYSVGGPRMEAGWQAQAEMAAGITDEDGQPFLTCEVSHGPFANVSIGLSDLLATLLDVENSSKDLWVSDFDQNLLYACPDGTNPPVIDTRGLPNARTDAFYLGQLGLTDDVDRDGTWSLDRGTGLPSGLSLDEDGNISGTVTVTPGEYPFSVKFIDERNRIGRADLTLRVTNAPEWDLIQLSPAVTCGLDQGKGWCWGLDQGGLGDGSKDDFGEPVSLPRLLNTPVKDFTTIVPGYLSGCALRTNGEVHCWGAVQATTADPEFFNNKPSRVTSITKPWVFLAGDGDDYCGIQQATEGNKGGSLWCFGINGTVPGGGPGEDGYRPQFEPKRVGRDTDWTSVSVSGTGSLCAIKVDQTLWCNDPDSSTKGMFAKPTIVGPAIKWASVDTAGGNAYELAVTCGIDTTGALYCWGDNETGTVGDGTTTPRLTPVRVGDLTEWRQVSAGRASVCGTTTGNALYCWGSNEFGALGDPDTSDPTLSPTQIGFPYWANVNVGGNSACATRTDGTGWCWGDNSIKQLGLGSTLSARQYGEPQPILARQRG